MAGHKLCSFHLTKQFTCITANIVIIQFHHFNLSFRIDNECTAISHTLFFDIYTQCTAQSASRVCQHRILNLANTFRSIRLPPPWRTRLGRVAGGLREALGGWLKAQGLLMLITFGELAAGFLLLRVELSLLLAGLVALVDALPVFGTGTVLLPWAVLALLGGDVRMSVGLLVLYSVISLVRSLLEPRLVGARVGLPPLAALVCMYVGFQALGVLGMLLAPLAAVLARQLWDSGLLHSLFGP